MSRYANLLEITKPGNHAHICMVCQEVFVDEKQAEQLLKDLIKEKKERMYAIRKRGKEEIPREIDGAKT